jgi:Zn-dependent metalloprotease
MSKWILIIMATLMLSSIVLSASPKPADSSDAAKPAGASAKNVSAESFSDSDFVEMAYAYISQHNDFFQTDNPRVDYVLSRVNCDDIGAFVELIQAVNGIKVGGSYWRFLFRSNGKLYDNFGRLFPEAKEINTIPSISLEQATQIALNDFQTQFPDSVPAHLTTEPEFLIGRFPGEFRLIWIIEVGSFKYIPYYYYIDAKTGSILEKGQAGIIDFGG